MAKMFYSLEEVKQKLGMSDEAIKALVAEGRLREFRDGQRIMYKVDDVNALAGGREEDLGLAGSGGPISLADESGILGGSKPGMAGGDSAEINLAGDTGSSIGLVPGDSADQISLDDTGPASEDQKDDTVITSHGVNVLDDSDGELELADPLAQTQIAPDFGDQVHLDSGSSGSGLLDLTREADDTSLGAELLDEIYPGGDEGQVETQLPTQLEVPSSPVGITGTETQAAAPALVDFARPVATYDPGSGAFGAMLFIPLVALLYMGFVVAGRMAGASAPLLDFFAGYKGAGDENFTTLWIFVGGAALISFAFFGVAHMVLGASGKPKEKKAKAPKAPKKSKGKK
ncbi:MAG: helix-turn-helix domain-containing protein [Sedimentisphaerales bacterium]|nr:helix-turn-helix domain-containing protein [Sedimentisphaerales bacterium]